MQKVLTGASREALGFIGANWMGLLKMSMIPVLVQMLVGFWQISNMGAFYRKFGDLAQGGQAGAEFMSSYLRMMAVSFVGSILALCLMGLLFVQVVRFRKGGVVSWLPMDKASWGAGVMTIVYAIGIALLTMLAYVAAALAMMIAFGILAVLFALVTSGGSGGAGAVLGVLFTILIVVAVVAFLFWFFFRFAVGLPVVALGHSPDFFKDMWTLSKGETWGVPLRMLLATLIMYVPMTILFAIFLLPRMMEVGAKIGQQAGDPNPLAMMPMMADMMDHMAPVTVLMGLIMMPYNWFVMLLLAIAFDRFRQRDIQVAAK
jgi:hypothetical protein